MEGIIGDDNRGLGNPLLMPVQTRDFNGTLARFSPRIAEEHVLHT